MKKILLQITLIAITNFSVFGQKINDDRMTLDFIPYCGELSEPVKKPIEMDWVQKDIKIIIDKINKVPEFSSSLDSLKELLPNFIDAKCNCKSTTQELGYGLKSTLHTIHGGYGSFNVDALYSDNAILKMRLTINNHEEIIEEYLVDEIKLPFTCLDGLPAYEFINAKNINDYIKTKGKLFIQSNDLNLKRKDAINYFANIYNGSEFKKPYHITFDLGTRTFDYLRYFIVNKDFKALEDLLYSANPTGRLFVARTLVYLKDKYSYKPTSSIENRITDVLSNSELIKSGIISHWANKFDYDYIDVIKDYEELLKTE